MLSYFLHRSIPYIREGTFVKLMKLKEVMSLTEHNQLYFMKVFSFRTIEGKAVRNTSPPRPITITLASLLCLILGILGLIGSVIIIFSTILGGVLMIDKVIALTGVIVAIIGLLSLITSILHIIAGRLLWGCLKKGGKLGIVLSTLGIIISIPLSITLRSITTIFTGALIDAILIVLIVAGWRVLR